ncbi:hypothetical protein [Cohnella hashimotonis]|uniref:Carrier domain-containing protein n=1 Tax=Cohnella hashimotonis TaxID=2826895 RepID=A0ABT6TMV0_9BACL|nr:hypothetical protein [Cohnella hashimotonis]MDI4648172.1 hypothetical protein [Cohnella hashimotonis]
MIRPFEPLMDIPYYYPCNLPLVREVLRRQGIRSGLGLLAAARLYGVPACSDTGLVKTYFNKLDYAEAVWRQTGKTEFASLEEGLREGQRLIGEGELFLVTGTSYYLPHCEDYLSPKYIEKLVDPGSRQYLVDHWLAVYGIEETRLHVYDPVPARYAGPLSLQAFDDFWKGNKAIPELANAKRKEELHSYCSIGIAAADDAKCSAYEEQLLQAVATHAHEFLSAREVAEEARTYYFGYAVTRRLLGQLHRSLAEGAAALGALSAFVFDMRWSRYFFRDLLREAAETLGSPFDGHAAAFDAIVADWEDAHKQLQGRAAAERMAKLGVALEALAKREHRLYEMLWADARGAGLFAKRQRSDARGPDGRRETILRIVLDSCEDLNRFQGGAVPVELGAEAPLYGRNGNLDSLGLVSLLASVEQGIEEALGCGIALSDIAAASVPDSPYRTVDTLVGYLLERLPEAG